MSAEKRFRMRPAGFRSKKLTGVRSSRRKMPLCRRTDALGQKCNAKNFLVLFGVSCTKKAYRVQMTKNDIERRMAKRNIEPISAE